MPWIEGGKEDRDNAIEGHLHCRDDDSIEQAGVEAGRRVPVPDLVTAWPARGSAEEAKMGG